MKIPLVDLKANYISHKKEIDSAIQSVINSTYFILGPTLKEFERNFAKFLGVKYCIGVNSGFSALELGIRALGIREGDEVITPVNSFIASSFAISAVGAKPIWVDIDDKTFNLDPALVEKKITPKTRAIMPVHLFGQSADMKQIMALAKKYNLLVIEDSCQAHGAKYKNKRVGTFGNFAAFSFYPGKNLGAYGDGGAIVTNDKRIATSVLQMRNYGQGKKYYHTTLAFNKRLDSLQAAVLNVKLKRLDDANSKRQAAASLYSQLLKGFPIKLPEIDSGRSHVFHLYVVRTNSRNRLLSYLHKQGIRAGIHYPIPIHLQKVYKSMNFRKGDFPIAEKAADEMISLPIYPEINDKQIRYVADNIKRFFKN